MNRLENLTEEERENLPKIFAQLGLFRITYSFEIIPTVHYHPRPSTFLCLNRPLSPVGPSTFTQDLQLSPRPENNPI